MLYSRAKAIVAVSHGVADDFKKTFKFSESNLYVVYNPVDISNIREKAKDVAEHHWFKKKGTSIIIGVGRLTFQKNFSTLIRAFALLRQRLRIDTVGIQSRKDVKLIILGEGEKRKELEKLIKDLGLQKDVDMPGFVDNPYAYLAQADVFVLSSKFEGFGNVLVESMACGIPIVSTDCPSSPAEILENGKYGKLVPVDDVEALAKAIVETLDNPISQEILKERASHFSVEKAVEKYLELILD